MKTITSESPLRIKCGNSVAVIDRVFIQLGHVRVEGWVRGANRKEAFDADREIARRLDVRSLNSNAWGATETEAVSLPFSFDVHNGFHAKYARRETMDETLERTMANLRSARYYFSRLT